MIELRATLPDDLPGLDRLFRRRFGHGLSAAEWRWKYLQIGQAAGEARSMVAVEVEDPGARGGGAAGRSTGEVVAHAGALAHQARHGDSSGPVWQLVDWVGETTGAGLRPPLVRLGRALLEDLPRPGDLPWIYGFPSERHFELGRRVFGYRPLPAIIPVVGDLEDLPSGLGTESNITSSDHYAVGNDTGSTDGDRAEGRDGAAATWDACQVNGVRRTAAFLNWRYHARPDRYYRFYRLIRSRSGGMAPLGPSGLAVFAFIGDEAAASELWLPGFDEDPQAWLRALLDVADDLRRSGIVRWRFWPGPARGRFATDLSQALPELKLRPHGSQTMGCRGRRGGGDPQEAAAGFYYAMGDYDLV